MSNKTLQDIDQRLRALERQTPRVRRGVVSADAPLSVKLGGSDTAYRDVPTLGAGPPTGGSVAVLTTGHDLLCLGELDGDTGWLTLPGEPGWENYGAPFATAAYRRIGKRVQVRGLVKHAAATGSSFIGTLPVGFRPSAQQGFACVGYVTAYNQAIRVDMEPDGHLLYEAVAAGAVGYLFLDTISFLVD